MDVAVTISAFETMPAISKFLEVQSTGVNFDQLLQQASEGIQGAFKTFALTPNRPTQDAYKSALAQRQEIREQIRRYFAQQDIVVLAFPPIMIPPPQIAEEAEITIRGEKVPLLVAMARNVALGSCGSMSSLVLPAGMTSHLNPA